MGAQTSLNLSGSGEEEDPDTTWYLPGELKLWEERHNRLKGVPMFLRRPVFEEKNIDDLPKYKRFKPSVTSSQLNIAEDGPEENAGAPDDRILYEEKPVPRGGPMRKLVPAHPCDSCDSFFKAAEIDAATVQRVCRHRMWNSRPKTPPHYWSPGWHSPEKEKESEDSSEEDSPSRANVLRF